MSIADMNTEAARETTADVSPADPFAPLRTAFSQVPDSAVGYTTEGQVVVWNKGAELLFGYTSEEALGRHFSMLCPPDDNDWTLRVFAQALSGKPIESRETERIRKDGSRVRVQVRITPLKDSEGNVFGVLFLSREFSEELLREKRLSEMYQREQEVARLVPDAMYVHQGGQIVWANVAAAKMFGTEEPSGLVGRSPWDLIAPSDLPYVRERHEQMDEGNVGTPIFVHRRKLDGETFPTEARGARVVWDDQPATLMVVRDRTERERTLSALAESEERQRQIAAATPDAMLIHVEGKVVFANEAAVEMFRAGSEDELVGHDVAGTLHPEDRYLIAENQAAFRAGYGDEFIEARRVRRDGTTFLGEGRSQQITWDGKSGFLVVIRDVTDRIAAQDALLASEQQHRQIVEVSPDAIIVHIDGEIVYANPAAAEMFRSGDVGGMIGRNSIELIPPDEHEATRRRREQIQATGSASLKRAIRRRLDGSEFTASITASRYIWDGQPATMTILRDVSAQVALEERHQRILDLSPNAIFVHCEGRFTYANPAAVELLGVASDADLIGRQVTEFVHPDELPRLREYRASLVQDGGVASGDNRFVRPDGTVVETSGTGTAISWDGEPGILVIARDVTRERAAEAERLAVEARYHRILDLAPQALFVHSDGIIRYANPAAARVLGVDSPEDLVGMNGLHFIHEEDREVAVGWRAELGAETGTAQWECRRVRKDGTVFPARTAMGQIDWDGEEAYIVAIHDITEERAAEAALRESESRYRGILDLAPQAIFVHSNGVVKYANPAAVALFAAKDRDDLIGRDMKEFMHPDDLPAALACRDKIEREGGATSYEARRRRLDGSEFLSVSDAAAIEWGGVAGQIVITRDISESRALEEALRDSEARHRHMIESSPDAILVHSDHEILFANRAALELYGAETDSELVGTRMLDLVPEDLQPAAQARAAKIAEQGFGPLMAFRHHRLDGAELHVETTGGLCVWDGRDSVMTIVREVEDKVAIERALRESEERHRQIVDLSPDAILVYAQNRILFANPAALELYGVATMDDFVGTSPRDLVPENFHEIIEARRKQVLAAGHAPLMELRHKRRDGTEFDVETLGCRYSWNGEPATLMMIRPIGDRAAVQSALRESEERHRQIVDVSPSAIIVHLEDEILFANPAACEMYGAASPDDLIGRDPLDIISEAEHASFGQRCRDMMDGNVVAQVEALNRRLDGAEFHAEVTGIRHVWNGTPAMLVVVNDVSERLQAEQNLSAARSIAEEANEMKSRFLAHMSHELRTPLNSIIGFSEMIKEQALGHDQVDRYSDYASDIHHSGRHLLSLINDLLDLSKAEAGKMDISEAEFDLKEAVDNAMRLVLPQAARKNLALDVQTDSDVCRFVGGEREITQVIVNLLSNAVKFTPVRGSVSLNLRASNADALVIEVEDTGVGIAPGDIEALFDPYTRAGGSMTSTSEEGTGLGLALSRHIVEAHGGSIRVDSAPGEGTTMRVVLPRERVRAAA